MILFETLTMRNFLSYGNAITTFRLDRPGTTLIVGQDMDNAVDDVIGSNGVGKTTTFQALVYALYDRVISDDATKDSLVNNVNKKEMEVTLTFKAENGNTYRIVRHRKMKSGADGNATYLYENGNDISVDAVGTNKKIVEILGMPYDLFVRIIVFSASNKSFLKLPVTSSIGPNQKTFIEDLFGLSVITEKAERLKNMIKDTKVTLDHKKKQIETKQAERDRHKTQVDAAERRLEQWELSRDAQIVAANAKLAKIDGVDIDGQRTILTKLKQVETTSRELTSEKTTALRECRGHAQLFDKIDGEIVLLKENKCPHCKQQFAGAGDEIKVKEAELIAHDTAIETLSDRVKEYEEMLEDLTLLQKQLERGITVDDVEGLARIQADAENMRARVEELRKDSNPHTEALSELKALKFDDIEYDEVNALQKELDHQNFLLKLLTKSDSFVRKNLLNKYLPFLNGRVQLYLNMLGLKHTVEFQEDLSAKISLNATEVNFGLMSTGQRARVDFAFSVAFKDVRERLHGRANICVFDEVLDSGLDAIGVLACAKVIKTISAAEKISMYVISHRAEVERAFEHKLTIQMVGKFSYIVES